MKEDFSNIINWNNLFKKLEEFKNRKPFNFAFIEEFFVRDFYEKLYENYPTIDHSWGTTSDFSKYLYWKCWNNITPNDILIKGDDTSLSEEWNKFKRYVETDEFVENFRKFSGIPVTKTKHFSFIAYEKGGFQFPHIHNVGPSTLIIMLYFNKNWQKGDPGGTYMASKEDESSIIFEPYNLDNTIAIFHDSPHSAHGVRYITKNVVRQGMQIYLEEYNAKTGWSGKKIYTKQIKV